MEPFRFKQFTVCHEASPMRVGTDGVTLGVLAPAAGRVLDVGCGCGLIGLMLAQRGAERVEMIDIDSAAAAEASANAAASPWNERLSVSQANFLTFNAPERFDSIVSNPPFFGTGPAAPDERRAAARLDSSMPPEAFMRKTAELLAPGGTVSVIIPADREQIWLAAGAFAGLHAREIIEIKTKATAPPKRKVLILSSESPTPQRRLLLLNSPEFKQLTNPFYL
ncbi:MAG: methyltransferase [Muribaculaceae bacterium]|nr:methyltransferase [Muribaculaceae bacterium]